MLNQRQRNQRADVETEAVEPRGLSKVVPKDVDDNDEIN